MMRHAIRSTLLAALLLIVAAGCGRSGEMEVRTFALERMTHEDALPLLTPYVGEGGTITGRGSLITVRAESAELERIAQIIARYDGPPAQIRIDVHVLEGGAFADSTGLAFESTLRDLLPYAGYRVLDHATFGVSEWSNFSRSGSGSFEIEGGVREVRRDSANAGASIGLRVRGEVDGVEQAMESTINAPFGETVVVASHRSNGDGRALVIALRADLIEQGAASGPARASAAAAESP